MKKLIVLFLIFASEVKAYKTPFVPFKGEFTKTKEFLINGNMPPVRSQDSIGVCFSFVASTMLDYSSCQNRKVDCRDIKDSERHSVLDLAGMQTKSILEGGSVYNILDAALNQASIIKESCAPFKAAVNKFSDDTEEQLEAWQNLRVVHNKSQSKKADCVDCSVRTIQEQFPGLKDKNKILSALNEKEFDKFLYKLLVPEECRKKGEVLGPPGKHIRNLNIYPETEAFDLNTAKNHIVKKVKNGTPVALSLCMDAVDVIVDVANDCKLLHSVIVTGVAEMCDKKGRCYEALKIHNSWGESWQKENNDGWVFADAIYNKIPSDDGAALTWLR